MLQKLASLYLMYVVGISCIVYGKYSLLDKVFHIKVPTKYGKEFLIEQVNCSLWKDNDTISRVLYNSQHHYAFSSFIEKRLQPVFAHLFTDSQDYPCTFDIFEYFLGINYCHIVGMICGHYWVPRGIFDGEQAIRRQRIDPNNPFDTFFTAASTNEHNWTPIKQGMFNGEYSVYQAAKQHADEFLKETRRPW